MASLLELNQSLDQIEELLLEVRDEVYRARDTRNPKFQSETLKKIQKKLIEAARIVPFDVKLN